MKLVLLGLLVGVAACSVWASGCYKGNPPCDPTTVDWPRCDPTQPAVARDAGADR